MWDFPEFQVLLLASVILVQGAQWVDNCDTSPCQNNGRGQAHRLILYIPNNNLSGGRRVAWGYRQKRKNQSDVLLFDGTEAPVAMMGVCRFNSTPNLIGNDDKLPNYDSSLSSGGEHSTLFHH